MPFQIAKKASLWYSKTAKTNSVKNEVLLLFSFTICGLLCELLVFIVIMKRSHMFRKTTQESRATLACLYRTSGRFYMLQFIFVDSRYFIRSWRYQLRMWACSGSTSYWKGSWAVITWTCPPFFVIGLDQYNLFALLRYGALHREKLNWIIRIWMW